MLCLTRKPEEAVVIQTTQGQITVTVVQVKGDKVKLGIDAPREIAVDRAEVAAKIASAGGGRGSNRS